MGFTSCSDDKKEENHAKVIAGTYKGDLWMSDTVATADVSIVITGVTTDTVTLAMNATVLTLPVNITCPATVTPASNNAYALAGSTTFTMPGATPVPVPVTISGTCNKSGAAELTIGVAVPVLGTVSVIYKGTKQ
jgi:hypothetical protein